MLVRLRGRFLEGLVELERARDLAKTQVEHFHEDRERHGEVDVALRDVPVEPLQDEGEPDQEQERQSEDLDRRVPGAVRAP